ncbi:hypothetical protein [Noviherbaspirillum sp. Root189]|uniref:hypothetical protein n=1 Tax=Noviherbaspirillum sp. Root189 TaxID=1736487 RepID=UPI00070FCE7A|nr:hypothetical protein [Noviherbaspirillum sp. Root189]KRB87891.1 hypothetical protein ASE07_19340 [Noviherbaspirillum sp. Root189]
MEEPGVSLEPTFVAAVVDGRFEFVTALLAAREVSDARVVRDLAAAVFGVVPPAFIFAAVFAADLTVLFTVLWGDLAIDFVAAGGFLRADAVLGTALSIFTASLPAAFPLDGVRDFAAVLTALRFVTDLVTVAFMMPSLSETPNTQLPA